MSLAPLGSPPPPSRDAVESGANAGASSAPLVPHPSSSSWLLSASLPRRFGRYTLFEPIGRGGMAELFLARFETELGATKLAVVKLILPAFAEDPKFCDMLIHEAKLAARLSHRHIVQVLDLGRDAPLGDGLDEASGGGEREEAPSEPVVSAAKRDAQLYIAMEYVEGFDLNALLRQCSDREVPLPPEHALGIVADVLEGLDYAHRRTTESGAPLGLVHRDVSPSNILISFDGEVKLCDFGIAHANDVVSADKNEALKGKASYMSPEHARADALDGRADVFAAGIILWELLSGRRLYRLRGDLPLLEQARRAEIPPIPDHGLPNQAELERIVKRALAKSRDERYSTAGAFQRDLEGYMASAGLLASRLKLGEWISSSFGTAVIEKRQASERRLPKSSFPPPRSSGAVRLHTSTASNVLIPGAPRMPKDLLALAPERRSTASARQPSKAATSDRISERSAKGTAMDRAPSSGQNDDSRAASKLADDELLTWARKRGWITFLFFFLIASVVALVWYFTR